MQQIDREYGSGMGASDGARRPGARPPVQDCARGTPRRTFWADHSVSHRQASPALQRHSGALGPEPPHACHVRTGASAEGEKLRAAAAVTGEKAKVGLTAGTIRKHFGNLQHFLKHIRGTASRSPTGPSRAFAHASRPRDQSGRSSSSRRLKTLPRSFRLRSIRARSTADAAGASLAIKFTTTRSTSCRSCSPISARGEGSLRRSKSMTLNRAGFAGGHFV